MWMVTGFIFIALSLTLSVMLFVQYKRFTKIIGEEEKRYENELDAFKTRTANFKEVSEKMLRERETMIQERTELTEQKFAMAEASVSLLELREQLTAKTEELEKQKYAMADANIRLMEVTENLREEQERSAKLLRNILPERVIEDLSKNGTSAPELFENVTVFFSDIVGFTSISSQLEPGVLIAELSEIFTAFDRIFVANGCERIKTIGDAYLSVSGMPVPCVNHCANIMKSALEAMQFIEERNRNSQYKWMMRMGIHSGKVVGGIVGMEKYIYDVFGDTINTASRMESNSEPMKINVSESSYQLVKEQFEFLPREPLEVKGKGVMNMFFLTGRK